MTMQILLTISIFNFNFFVIKSISYRFKFNERMNESENVTGMMWNEYVGVKGMEK